MKTLLAELKRRRVCHLAGRGERRARSRLIRLWENADPELQPRVETARRALERLTAEGPGP